MVVSAPPARLCRVRDCERAPHQHSVLCDAHYRAALSDALAWIVAHPDPDWTRAFDERDGGHDDR